MNHSPARALMTLIEDENYFQVAYKAAMKKELPVERYDWINTIDRFKLASIVSENTWPGDPIIAIQGHNTHVGFRTALILKWHDPVLRIMVISSVREFKGCYNEIDQEVASLIPVVSDQSRHFDCALESLLSQTLETRQKIQEEFHWNLMFFKQFKICSNDFYRILTRVSRDWKNPS